MTPELISLLQQLDSKAVEYRENDLYYCAKQPLAFLSPESKAALSNRFGRIASNIPRLAVNSLAERLRVTGFVGADVWDDFIAGDLDQWAGVVHREALSLGQSFCIVWVGEDGKPLVTVESAHQVCVRRDAATRQVVAALKRYRTETETHAFVYTATQVQHWVAKSPSATTAGYELVEKIPNPLGVVPVVPFTNSDRLLDSDGRSEIDDLKPLVDGLNKTLADLAVAQEFTARPRRWATGIELVERPVLDEDGNPVTDPDTDEVVTVTENPIPEGNRAMISEEKDAKFGQLSGASLDGYEASVKIWLGQIQAVSALPGHLIGIMVDSPTSADALRASESSLTARAEQKAQTFGKSWEQVARLIVAVRDGVDPSTVSVRVVWADASTRSIAQEADAAVKLFSAGVLSRVATLKRLGLNDDEITEEVRQYQLDAEDAASIRLGRAVTSRPSLTQ
jgi:hypothetical protein